MTVSGERGIVCRMQIEPDSQKHLQQFTSMKTSGIKSALTPLVNDPPKPIFRMHWDEAYRAWQSKIAFPNELPDEIQEVLKNFGYGCLAVEADIGVVHVCHAVDADINGFANKPVISRWQLIKMPTAPLIRLELVILDRPENPFRFESFLNVDEDDQANILARLQPSTSTWRPLVICSLANSPALPNTTIGKKLERSLMLPTARLNVV
jgi:hypothetical protein